MKYSVPLILLIFALFIGCKDAAKVSNEVEKTIDSNNKYSLTPFSQSQSYPDAKISNMTYNNGKFSFDVEGESYQLGLQTPDADSKMCANSVKGQHIHLIVDNSPYAAKYEAEFEHKVPDGTHTILAFLSRSYHESIKTDKANILKIVDVRDGNIIDARDIKSPILSYSRPKGTYVGKDTEKVMLDFYLSNVELKDGYTVQAKINDQIHEITKWQPYYIEGMPMGENKITLTLMKDGIAAEVPMNPVSRTFTLKADPSPEN